MIKRINWAEKHRDAFAATWPCCDIPATGYAEFADNGDLVGISDNTEACEVGGGLATFLSDLRDGKQGFGIKWTRPE